MYPCPSVLTLKALFHRRQFDRNLVVDNMIDKPVPSNENYPDSGLSSTEIFTLEAFQALSGVAPVGAGCGPAVRLTSSAAREAGAMWYARKGECVCLYSIIMVIIINPITLLLSVLSPLFYSSYHFFFNDDSLRILLSFSSHYHGFQSMLPRGLTRPSASRSQTHRWSVTSW